MKRLLRRFAGVSVAVVGMCTTLLPYAASANPNASSSVAYFGGGFDHNLANDMAADSNGNVYISGEMRSKSVFGSSTFIGQGNSDGFIVKVDLAQNILWAHQLLGANTDAMNGIATDHWDNVFAVGYYENSATFAGRTLTSSGSGDGFLVKLSPNGDVSWIVNVGGTQDDVANGVATHDNGDVSIVGHFRDTISIGSESVTSVGDEDIFVARFNTYGDLLWLRRGGSVGVDVGTAIATDIFDNTHISGFIGGNAIFGSLSLNKTGSGLSSDAYLTSLSANGTFSRAQLFTSSDTLSIRSIAADLSGNVALIGYQLGSSTIGSFSLTSSSGGYDGVLLFVEPDEDIRWAKLIGASQNEFSRDVVFDEQGNLYITGDWGRTFSFDSISLTSNGSNYTDIYVAKLNTQGAYQWVHQYGLEQSDSAGAIAVDRAGRVHTAGSIYMLNTTYTLDLVVFNVLGADAFTRAIPTTTTTTSSTTTSTTVATTPSQTTEPDAVASPLAAAKSLPDTGSTIQLHQIFLVALCIIVAGSRIRTLRSQRSS